MSLWIVTTADLSMRFGQACIVEGATPELAAAEGFAWFDEESEEPPHVAVVMPFEEGNLYRALYAAERVPDVNARRAEKWHGPDWLAADDQWTIADWSNAMAGEAGEAANIVKKIRRNECVFESGVPARPDAELYDALADELADVVLYADLLAQKAGIDLGTAVREKFNRKSEEQGFDERL